MSNDTDCGAVIAAQVRLARIAAILAPLKALSDAAPTGRWEAVVSDDVTAVAWAGGYIVAVEDDAGLVQFIAAAANAVRAMLGEAK